MQSLTPGEWYQVRLPEKDGHSHMVRGIFRNGYVGRLQECDENSLTLTDVTKCTFFDSTSALRRLPLGGSYFENGWMSCKNESAPVTVRRSQLMWFEKTSVEEDAKYRRCAEAEEVAKSRPLNKFSGIDSDIPTDFPLPGCSFLFPNPQSEEKLSQRRIEILEIQAGQWYFVFMPLEGQGTSRNQQVHFGLVHQVNEDSMTLINVTTQCAKASATAVDRIAIETSSELTLPRSQIEKVRQVPPEEVAEQIAEINQPREPILSEGK